MDDSVITSALRPEMDTALLFSSALAFGASWLGLGWKCSAAWLGLGPLPSPPLPLILYEPCKLALKNIMPSRGNEAKPHESAPTPSHGF